MVSRRGLLFVAIAAAVVAADQLTKAVVRAQMAVFESVPVIDGVLWFTHVENTGAAFGMLRGQQWLLVATAVAMLAVVAYVMIHIRPADQWVRFSLALVSGGAIGNLIDRTVSGAVTDFFDLGWFPVFNVADIALDVGVAILVLLLLLKGEHALVGHHAHRTGTTSEVPHEEGEVLATDVRPTDA
ncbi:MAG: signal peptidase II [Coriobacteriia bacterium]|nr:signal peptidase II [Coriobacteriia bacterium]MBN2841102.1 signal peptidase II [Coriobacteriia bacterium]